MDKVQMIVMSHLSDVQEIQRTLMSPNDIKTVNNKINFVKFCILQYRGNLAMECNPSALWSKFAGTGAYQH